MDIGLAVKPDVTLPDLIVPPDVCVKDERGTLMIWYSKENWCERNADCNAIMVLLSGLICQQLHDSYRYVEVDSVMVDVISGGWSDNPFALAITRQISYRKHTLEQLVEKCL